MPVIRYVSHRSERWYEFIVLYLHLQALLWAQVHQELLWDQFFPVQRDIKVSYIHIKYCTNNHRWFFLTYYFSFRSFESLWSSFSDITLQTSDETHRAIHWWDQPSFELWMLTYTDLNSFDFWVKCDVKLTVFPIIPAMPGLPLKPGKPWRQTKYEVKGLTCWVTAGKSHPLFKNCLLCRLQIPSGLVNLLDHVGPETQQTCSDYSSNTPCFGGFNQQNWCGQNN